MNTKIACVVAAGGVVAALVAAPAAEALPNSGICNYPGIGQNTMFGGWCDYPPVISGVHYHCQWGPSGSGMLDNMGGCDWRDPGNAIVPPPPPDQVMW